MLTNITDLILAVHIYELSLLSHHSIENIITLQINDRYYESTNPMSLILANDKCN